MAFADRLLLNKTDLVDDETLDALEKQLKDINKCGPSTASMATTTHHKV